MERGKELRAQQASSTCGEETLTGRKQLLLALSLYCVTNKYHRSVLGKKKCVVFGWLFEMAWVSPSPSSSSGPLELHGPLQDALFYLGMSMVTTGFTYLAVCIVWIRVKSCLRGYLQLPGGSTEFPDQEEIPSDLLGNRPEDDGYDEYGEDEEPVQIQIEDLLPPPPPLPKQQQRVEAGADLPAKPEETDARYIRNKPALNDI